MIVCLTAGCPTGLEKHYPNVDGFDVYCGLCGQIMTVETASDD